jgi:glycosyltransferase involved in cell wall biosynthesis
MKEARLKPESENRFRAQKTISLLICTYNRSSVVRECLKSICEMRDPGCLFEVIVVDNNSSDDTSQKIREFINENRHLDIRLFNEKMQGLSFARNLAAQRAEGDLLVFLDDDAIVDKNYLSCYRRYYQENEFLCMGGKILPWYKDKTIRIPSWFNQSNWGVLSMLDMGEVVKEVGYPALPYGGNLAIAKSLFEEFGLFNEHMGRKGKKLNSNMEIEFMCRLKKSGIPVYYVPDAIIYHLVQTERLNRRFFFRRFYAQGKSDVYLFTEQKGIMSIFKQINKRFLEFLFAPFLFFYRKSKGREDYFKPILRIFYNIGYISGSIVSLIRYLISVLK